jgi:O-antigen/teichoic acid export membrane protein
LTATLASPNPRRLVLRNTLISLGAQVVGTPLSILLTAVMARYLGASDFGQIYVAWMLASFGFLVVEWGQGAVLTGSVARDRTAAGRLLGTALLWRCVAAVLVYGLLTVGCAVLRYPREFQIVLVLVVAQCLFQSLASACQDTVRGFERTDIGAYGQVAQQLLAAVLVVPTLMLGGRLRGVLVAQAASSALVLAFVWRSLQLVGTGRLAVSRDALKALVVQGTPFMLFSFSMTLQPNVDAVLLSKLAPGEVVGWHAVSRRLIGALVLPASLIVGALYPTLSRLYGEDRSAYTETVRSALRATIVLAVPIALGCALYPDLGVLLYSRKSYGPAQANLVVLSGFLLLMYVSMPLGIAILAAGRQKAWAAAQFLCVIVSSVLDPLLIPWFQARMGNGGLGVCVASVVSEVLMVGAGVWLAPVGFFDRGFARGILRGLCAGGAMTAVAMALSRVTSFVAAPIAVGSYVISLWAMGGLGGQQVALLREALSRKVGKVGKK